MSGPGAREPSPGHDGEARPRASLAGYAVGTGAAVMALAAPFLHFAFPEVSDLIHFGGTFVVGGAVGTWIARRRTPYLGD